MVTQFLSSPAVAMECHGERVSGAAKRRRERRLRQWHRHERLTVQMALCEALHHAAPQVERGENSAPRGQKTHKAGGRPGVLKEPEPQGAVTVGYVAAPGPLLEVASMAGGDSVDGTALRFLVKKALDRQKEEEEQAKVKRNEEEKEERRMKRINEMLRLELPVSLEEREAWRRWIALLFVVLIWEEEEEEEEEEEADASYLLSSWTRSSSTPTVACFSSTCGRCPCCAVQQQRRDLRRQLHLLPVQVEWQGSQRAVGGVSVL